MVRGIWARALLLGLLMLACAAPRAGAEEAARTCRVGIYITALGDFNLQASSFGADLRLWSLCPAAPGAPPPLATADLGNSVHVTLAELRREAVGDSTYAHRRATGRFWHHWHLVTFPFDRHRLDILIQDAALDRDAFRYVPDAAQSGLNPGFRLPGWQVIRFELVEEPHTYPTTLGDPRLGQGRTVSRLRASVLLAREDAMGFVKLTAALYAASLMALLAFFSDPGHPSIYGGRMSLLVGALFAVVVNLRSSDAALGDAAEVTLMAQLHVAGAFLIVAIALVTVRHRRRAERGRPIRHPDWPVLLSLLAAYAAANVLLVMRAATAALP